MSAGMVNSDLDAIRLLAEGLDTQKLDGFLDRMFEMAAQFGNVVCMLKGDDVLLLQSADVVLQELTIPRAKTKIRMLCARLAVRCSGWSNREVSPYGDELVVFLPESKQAFKVRFENTTSAQSIAIEFQGASRA